LLALFIGIFFHLIFGFLATGFKGTLGVVFNYLGVSGHFGSISRGVIDTKDLIYFLSLVFMGLIATEANMARRHLSD
jgi:ABC-2 type transport system permease protein